MNRSVRSSGARVVIDRPFHRAENFWNQLPLVDQDGLVEPAQRGIGVGPHDSGMRWDVRAQDRSAAAPGRGRLPARAGAGGCGQPPVWLRRRTPRCR